MKEYLKEATEIIIAILAFIGIGKLMTKNLHKRLCKLEEIEECHSIEVIETKLAVIEKAQEGFSKWLVRIEDKLDRVIERL